MVWLDNTNAVDIGFLSIDSRIKVSDDYGTIRYLGQVNINKFKLLYIHFLIKMNFLR